MSASPDDPDFLKTLLGPNGSLDTSLNSPLMGIAMGLLQAGGPSRMPVSFGQALGQGIQTGQQFQSQGVAHAMQQIELQKQKAQLGFMTDAGQTQATNPSPGDPTQDPVYQHYVHGAMAGVPGMADLASQRLNTMKSQYRNLDPKNPQDLALMGGNAPPVGQTYQTNGFGEIRTAGEPRYKDVTWQSPTDGSVIHGRLDQTTGQVNQFNIPGTGTPSKPQKGDLVVDTPDGPVNIPASYVAQVKKIASYDEDMPKSSGRNPVLARNMNTWVAALNPDWGEGQFQAKNTVLKSASGGTDAKKLDAFNTIQSHLASLQQAWSALKNGDIQGANKLANWAGVQFGKAAPSNAAIVNTLVGRELAAVLASGGQVTDADKKEANVINDQLSQGQQEGAIANIRNLIGGKTNSVVTRFKASHLSDNDIKTRFTPDAWQAFQTFQSGQQGSSAANPAIKSMSNADLLKQLGISGG